MKKLSDAWMVKRSIKISELINHNDESTIMQVLVTLQGIETVNIDRNSSTLTIRYDASQLNYQTIYQIIIKTGIFPQSNWWIRLKTNWYQFIDENIRENANAPKLACCNKPPNKLIP